MRIASRQTWFRTLSDCSPLVAALSISTIVAAADTQRSGIWLVASATVQAGDRIVADGTLRIISIGPVVIDGQIEAAEGASIEIVAPVIRIRGGISTADGRHSRAIGARGQHAGSITLDAGRIVLIGGAIAAGNGGNGGRSGHGGNGGSVTIVGCPVLSIDEHAMVRAGSGGNGGDGIDGYTPAEMNAGDGGDAGKLVMNPSCITAPSTPAPRFEKQSQTCGSDGAHGAAAR